MAAIVGRRRLVLIDSRRVPTSTSTRRPPPPPRLLFSVRRPCRTRSFNGQRTDRSQKKMPSAAGSILVSVDSIFATAPLFPSLSQLQQLFPRKKINFLALVRSIRSAAGCRIIGVIGGTEMKERN